MATVTQLLTAQEFSRLPESLGPLELVRGEIVAMNVPNPRHGQVCVNVTLVVGGFVKRKKLGRLVSNDSGVVTSRDPDSVRGADVAYYSFQRVPAGPLPSEYLSVPPEVVFEVLSPSDRWSQLLTKLGEYLNVGVETVVVLDSDANTAQVFYPNRPNELLSESDELRLAAISSDAVFRVGEFFE